MTVELQDTINDAVRRYADRRRGVGMAGVLSTAWSRCHAANSPAIFPEAGQSRTIWKPDSRGFPRVVPGDVSAICGPRSTAG